MSNWNPVAHGTTIHACILHLSLVLLALEPRDRSSASPAGTQIQLSGPFLCLPLSPSPRLAGERRPVNPGPHYSSDRGAEYTSGPMLSSPSGVWIFPSLKVLCWSYVRSLFSTPICGAFCENRQKYIQKRFKSPDDPIVALCPPPPLHAKCPVGPTRSALSCSPSHQRSHELSSLSSSSASKQTKPARRVLYFPSSSHTAPLVSSRSGQPMLQGRGMALQLARTLLQGKREAVAITHGVSKTSHVL